MPFAAHVDHKIGHSGSGFTLGMGIAAALIGAAAVLALPVVAVALAGVAVGAGATALTIGAIGVGATAGGIGMSLGAMKDAAGGKGGDDGDIKSGLDSVRLGPDVKPAVRALADDSKIKRCHDGKKLAE